MKSHLLVVGASLVVSFAGPVCAQTASQSDDYVCSHGDPGDATDQACARLHRPWRPTDAETEAPSSERDPAAVSRPTTDAAYAEGQSDRQHYEAWVHGLTGDYLAGAGYWESHRSVPHHDCSGSDVGAVSANWLAGCVAAQQWLAESDRLRHASPTYRAGWNNPPADDPYAAFSTPAAPAASDAAQAAASAATSAQPPSPPAVAPSPPPSATDKALAAINAMVPVLLGIFVIGVAIALYFLPTLIAMRRKKRNTAAIFALNLFLGWTLLGWVLALVWGLSVDDQATV